MSTKVIVIDSHCCEGAEAPPFKDGETVHISEVPKWIAIHMIIFKGFNPENWCVVDEYPLCSEGWIATWKKSRFVPVSDIDEKEFIREYNKQLA